MRTDQRRTRPIAPVSMGTINYLLSGGSHDGYMGTLYRQEPPIDLRVAFAPQLEDEIIIVDVYRLSRVDPMPVKTLGKSATYMYQGSRPSAGSLIDIVV